MVLICLCQLKQDGNYSIALSDAAFADEHRKLQNKNSDQQNTLYYNPMNVSISLLLTCIDEKKRTRRKSKNKKEFDKKL